MNRRKFVTTGAAITALMPSILASARNVTPFESPILEVFRMLPAQPDDDGFDFPVTTGTLGELQRSVWPENPDKYWDPEGEDYLTILGFHPTWTRMKGTQAGVSLWQLSPTAYDQETTQERLESNGWELVDDELRILHYTGDEDARNQLAGSLNLLGNVMRNGDWDWVALPDASSVVIGSNENRVRLIADRVQNHPAMTSMYLQFEQLRPMVRLDSYLVSLLPPQRLPVATAQQAFVSRAWSGDTPIIHSIGLQLESDSHVQEMIDTVRDRLEAQSSALLGSPYADFLEIVEIAERRSTVRFDLVDSSGEWDIFRALETDDLLMLPPAQ